MSFHFSDATVTFSFCCLLLGQLSSHGVLLGVEAKALPNSSTSSPNSPSNESSTGPVTDIGLHNDTSSSPPPVPANLTSFSTASSAGNDSLESLELSSKEMDGENKTGPGTLLMPDDDEQQSILSALLSSPIDHNSNMSIEDLDGSGDVELSTDASDNLDEMGSGSGSGSGESGDLTLETEGSGSGEGEGGFGSSLLAAIEGMFHFTQTNATSSNNSTDDESLWSTDPTGTEIQALMFA